MPARPPEAQLAEALIDALVVGQEDVDVGRVLVLVRPVRRGQPADHHRAEPEVREELGDHRDDREHPLRRPLEREGAAELGSEVVEVGLGHDLDAVA